MISATNQLAKVQMLIGNFEIHGASCIIIIIEPRLITKRVYMITGPVFLTQKIVTLSFRHKYRVEIFWHQPRKLDTYKATCFFHRKQIPTVDTTISPFFVNHIGHGSDPTLG